MISFEIILGTTVLIIFLLTGSFTFELIVDVQHYIATMLFLPTLTSIMFIAMLMETNRPPFDISEAESDLVAGYSVEYGGILFGLFYLGEYLKLFVTCAIVVIFFCGGWVFQLVYPYY